MTLNELIGQPSAVDAGNCRFCETPLLNRFVDVSWSMGHEQVNHVEPGRRVFMPTYVCPQCFLIQVPEKSQPTPDGPFYASAFSSSWFGSVKEFSDRAFSKLEFTDHGVTVELAGWSDELSGRLTFQEGLSSFIDTYGKASLLITHDELTHIPDINGFLSAVKLFLAPDGVTTFEFLHVVHFMDGTNAEVSSNRYFPYFSLTTWDRMLTKYGMMIFEVEACQPKGSLRIYAKHAANPIYKISDQVRLLRGRERDRGICSLSTYREYKTKAEADNQSHFVTNKEGSFISINQKSKLLA